MEILLKLKCLDLSIMSDFDITSLPKLPRSLTQNLFKACFLTSDIKIGVYLRNKFSKLKIRLKGLKDLIDFALHSCRSLLTQSIK